MLTFSQVHVGLPVFHAMLKVRIAACVVTSVSGTLVPGIALEPTPTIGRKEALRIAAAGTPGGANTTATGPPQLGIHRGGRLDDSSGVIDRLAYEVRVQDDLSAGVAEDVYVDAGDGTVLDRSRPPSP